MQCAEFAECLSAYTDGQLGAVEQHMIKEHLSRCVRCQVTLRRQRQTRQLLHLVEGDSWTPPDLRLRVRHASVLPDTQPHRHVPWLAVGSLAAVMLVGALLATYAFVPRGEPVSRQAAAAHVGRSVPAIQRVQATCLACLAHALVRQLGLSKKLDAGMMVEVTLAYSTAEATHYPPLPQGWPTTLTGTTNPSSKGGEAHTASIPSDRGLQAS